MNLHHFAIASALFVAGLSFGCVLHCVREGRPREAAWSGVLMFVNLLGAALLT